MTSLPLPAVFELDSQEIVFNNFTIDEGQLMTFDDFINSILWQCSYSNLNRYFIEFLTRGLDFINQTIETNFIAYVVESEISSLQDLINETVRMGTIKYCCYASKELLLNTDMEFYTDSINLCFVDVYNELIIFGV